MMFYSTIHKKRANRKITIGLYTCEQILFTNNVSWLGDPRLNKGRLY